MTSPHRAKLDQLLLDAASGSSDSIDAITNYATENRVTDVNIIDFAVDTLLHHNLSFPISRSSPTSVILLFRSDPAVPTAVATLQLLVAFMCITHDVDSDHRKTIIRRLERGWTCVSGWVASLTVLEAYEELCARVIASVLYFSGSGFALVARTALSVRVIHSLWTSPFKLEPFDGVCGRAAVWDMTFYVMGDDSGSKHLNSILQRRDKALEFAASLTRRLYIIMEELKDRPEQYEVALCHLAAMSTRIVHFQENRRVWFALKRADSLPLTIRLLRFIGTHCHQHLDSRDWRLLSSLGVILLHQCQPLPMEFNPIAHTASVLKAGLVPLILMTLSYLVEDPVSAEVYRGHLRDILSLFVYPQVFKAMHCMFQPRTPSWKQCVDALSRCSGATRVIWHSMASRFRELSLYSQAREAKTKRYICDNRKHVGRLFVIEHKWCPCLLVAYCSVECQRLDWRSSHRFECPLSKVSPYRPDLVNGRTKRFLAGYILYLFHRSPVPRTTPPCVVLITPEENPLVATLPLTDYATEVTRAPVFARPVVTQFLESVSESSLLIEGTFKWGSTAVIRVLVLVRAVSETSGTDVPWVASTTAYISYQ